LGSASDNAALIYYLRIRRMFVVKLILNTVYNTE
jgi:hypothetical protein